jgi:hypothetical protein
MRTRCPQVGRRQHKIWATAWALPLLSALSGCAGTPWGDTLSGSFPSPQVPTTAEKAAPAAPNPMEGEAPPRSPSPAPPAQTGSSAAAPAPGARPTEPKNPATEAPKPAVPKPTTSSVATAPSPYRVTIRLPQADPSAPAEGVTEALRTAGIPFEVETIERVNGASPTVRPAPPPR